TRDDVEGGCLAGPGATRYEHVHATEHRGLEELGHARAEAAPASEGVHAEDGVLELADSERCAVDGGRPDDRVDTAAIRQARVHPRAQSLALPPRGGGHT